MQSVFCPFGLLRLGMLAIELWLTQDYFVTIFIIVHIRALLLSFLLPRSSTATLLDIDSVVSHSFSNRLCNVGS